MERVRIGGYGASCVTSMRSWSRAIVVATTIPGCIDAIEDGVTGTLVPPRDVEELTGAIRMYLDDPDLRERHGAAGRERVMRDFRQEMTWDAISQEYCQLLWEKGLPVSKAPGIACP